MPLPTCTVTITLYKPDGTPLDGKRVRIHKVVDTTASIELPDAARYSDPSDENGVIEIDFPRGSNAYVSFPAIVEGNDFSQKTNPRGKGVVIPNAATANFEDLVLATTLDGIPADEFADLVERVEDLEAGGGGAGYQLTSEKNQANGYAGLDGSGLIPDNRLPSSIARDSEVTAAVAAEALARDTAIGNSIALILNGAPAALDTLEELANALGDDANFAASVTNSLATKQPIDSDLTAIAGLSPSNDDVLQRKSGAWINRTPAQLKTDLSLAKGDVGLSNVDNTSDANKPVSTATQAALDGKAATAHTHTLATGATDVTATAAELNALHNVKRYVALLTQTGTSAPVATVLENTLGGTVVWARAAQGVYTATLASAFTAGKTIILMGQQYTPADGVAHFKTTHTSATVITVESWDINAAGTSAGLADVILTSTTIEIRVYP